MITFLKLVFDNYRISRLILRNKINTKSACGLLSFRIGKIQINYFV